MYHRSCFAFMLIDSLITDEPYTILAPKPATTYGLLPLLYKQPLCKQSPMNKGLL
jgi:hypothetical protein